MRRRLAPLGAVCLLALVAAVGSAAHAQRRRSSIRVAVTSEPAGATVTIEPGGEVLGVTPAHTRLGRGRYTFVLRLEGYQEARRDLRVLGRHDATVHAVLERAAPALAPREPEPPVSPAHSANELDDAASTPAQPAQAGPSARAPPARPTSTPARSTPGLAAPSPVRLDVGAQARLLSEWMWDEGPAPMYDGTFSMSTMTARLMTGIDVARVLAIEAHLVIAAAMVNKDTDVFSAFGDGWLIGHPDELLPLQLEIARDPAMPPHYQVRGRVDRLSVRAMTRWVDVTLGRQPVTLGYARVFTAVDLVTLLPLLATATDFKPGIDAARVDVSLGDATGLTLFYGFGPDLDPANARAFAQLRSSIGALEGALFQMVIRRMPYTAAATQLQLDDLTLRAEGGVAFVNNALDTAPWFALATLGGTYELPFDVELTVEAYYFGFGTEDVAQFPAVFANPRQAIDVPDYFGKYQLGAYALYSPWSIVQLGVWWIHGVLDSSGIVSLVLKLTPADAVTLQGWVDLPYGGRSLMHLVPTTEYALVPYAIHADVKVDVW